MTTEMLISFSDGSFDPMSASFPLAECRSCQEQIRVQEREHLARELHDALGSLLMSAKLDIAGIQPELSKMSPAASQRFCHLMDTLNQAMALKSRVVDGLGPPLLVKQGLVKSITQLAKDFSSVSGIGVTIQLDEVALFAPSQLAVYRLVEEALTNIGKYASASRSSITLLETVDCVQVEVEDDGVGFSVDTKENFGHGLTGMRYRIEACGGTLVVDSAPGCGTRVRARLPAHAVVAMPYAPTDCVVAH
jgi:signal transduction histidine kinase